MTESVSDVLESYQLEDEIDEVLDLIKKAKSEGMKRKEATPAVVVHAIHINTHKTWAEICTELGTNPDTLLKSRKQLKKYGVIDNAVDTPSTLLQGDPAHLLELAENTHSDEIYDGTNPNSWVAGAIYLDEWVNLRETPAQEVANRYDCNHDIVIETAERLVGLKVFPRAYATEKIDVSLGALLARRRHSLESLRRSISDTSSGARRRLRDLEQADEWELQTIDFGDVEFYWTIESAGKS